MTQAAVLSQGNPYGRVCTICGGSDRDSIDSALAAGGSVSQLSQQFSVSRDCLYRHLKFHLRPALEEAAKTVPGFEPTTLVHRVRSIADDARAARVTAYASGNVRLGLSAGDAETRALVLLSDRLGIDEDAVNDQFAELEALADAVAQLIEAHPAIGCKLAELLSDSAPGLAQKISIYSDRCRAYLDSQNKKEIR